MKLSKNSPSPLFSLLRLFLLLPSTAISTMPFYLGILSRELKCVNKRKVMDCESERTKEPNTPCKS